MFINSISRLIESGAEKHEKVAYFEHGIVFNCATTYFMEAGGIHVHLYFVGDVYVSFTAEFATAY